MSSLPLGGLSARRFLREYWQRRPLFAAHALPQLPQLLDATRCSGSLAGTRSNRAW